MSYQTSPEATAFILGNLNEDLELLAQQGAAGRPAPALHPVLPRNCENGLLPSADEHTAVKPEYHPQHYMLLQVVSVHDISLPLEQRLRALVGGDAARGLPSITHRSTSRAAQRRGSGGDGGDSSGSSGDEEEGGRAGGSGGEQPSVADAVLRASELAHEAQRRLKKRGVSGRRRWLSFVLTDGFTRVLAVEARPPLVSPTTDERQTALVPEGVAMGAKLKVLLSPAGVGAQGEVTRWAPQQSHGILRLHRLNTVPMGGAVPALEAYWQRWAHAQLAALSGRPGKDLVGRSAGGGGGGAVVTTSTMVSSLPTPPPPPPPPPQQDGLHSLPCRPLTDWPTRPPPLDSPFLTRAVITEVVSDLLIHELADEADVASRAAAPAHSGSAPAGGDGHAYSLMVALSTPESAQTQESLGVDGGGLSLHVDLGHHWLQQLVGMPASQFRVLSQSQAAQDVERLQRIIEHVGSVLEGLGEAFFTLRQRPGDGVVETLTVQPVVGAGHVQQDRE